MTTSSEVLIAALKKATRFNSPDEHRPGYRRIGFILPDEIAWPSDKTGYDIPDLLLRLVTASRPSPTEAAATALEIAREALTRIAESMPGGTHKENSEARRAIARAALKSMEQGDG